jgi:predicted nucleotidyltransferase
MAGLPEREDAAVRDLVNRLRRRLGGRLVEIRLYGSKARRSDSPESDVDLAAILKRRTVGIRIQVFEEVSNVILEHDVLLDVHLLDAQDVDEMRSMGTGYAKRLDRDGVPLVSPDEAFINRSAPKGGLHRAAADRPGGPARSLRHRNRVRVHGRTTVTAGPDKK